MTLNFDIICNDPDLIVCQTNLQINSDVIRRCDLPVNPAVPDGCLGNPNKPHARESQSRRLKHHDELALGRLLNRHNLVVVKIRLGPLLPGWGKAVANGVEVCSVIAPKPFPIGRIIRCLVACKSFLAEKLHGMEVG